MFGKYRIWMAILVLVFSARVSGVTAGAAESNRRVVVLVWDGMRPDFVTEKTTPTLWKLSREGVAFRNHHAVYPSATMVNGTAIVTGVCPGRSGVIANYAYRPDINQTRSIAVESPAVVSRGDELSAGKYISVPTIADLIQSAGRRTVMSSAKSVGLLLDRNARSGPAKNRVTLVGGQTLPGDVITSLVAALGPFPPRAWSVTPGRLKQSPICFGGRACPRCR